MLSILYGISSVLVWGAGDFTGGLASRKTETGRVVVLSELVGLIILLVLALLTSAPFPSWSHLAWAGLAGALGCAGLVMLYQSFAEGKMSIAAPVSALLSAALPIVVGIFTEGLPGWYKFLGFGFALAAIWLVSSDEHNALPTRLRLADLRLPLFSGLFFGLYFILIERSTQQTILWPMICSRSAGMMTVITFLLLFKRGPLLPPRPLWPLVSLNAVFDIGGNALYILSAQAGRLDVAAVLGSLYPASTVLLASLLLKEKGRWCMNLTFVQLASES